MGEKLKEITEKTSVQLGVVILLISGAFWISSVASEAKSAYTLAEECALDFKIIDERLSWIEGHLGRK